MSKPFNRAVNIGLISLLLTSLWVQTPVLAKTNYKNWLEREVIWIISKSEKKEFEDLKQDEDREQFIERFWRRRDPSPSTPRNEYKEEHYRRLTFANRVFREGIPGWKSDRGRIYILHGPPNNESYFDSRSTLRDLPNSSRNPNTLVWTYHQLPDAQYYKGEMRVVFQSSSGPSRQDFALSESMEAQRRADERYANYSWGMNAGMIGGDVRYKLVMVGPPTVVNASGADLPASGVSEQGRYLEDLLRAPGELLEAKEAELARRTKVMDDLKQEIVGTQISFDRIALEIEIHPFFRKGKDWLIPISFALPFSELKNERLDVYAVLRDSRGKIFDEFIDSVEMIQEGRNEQPDSKVSYYNSFSAPSGSYELAVILREIDSKRSGFSETALTLEEVVPDKINLGSVLLTNRIEMIPERQSDEEEPTPAELFLGNAVEFNQTRLLPHPTRRFSQQDYLFLYLQLWTPAGAKQVLVNANFILDGQIAKQLEPRVMQTTDSPLLEYGTMLPLSDFAPGDYTLQIQAFDHTTKTFDIERVRFELNALPEQASQ